MRRNYTGKVPKKKGPHITSHVEVVIEIDSEFDAILLSNRRMDSDSKYLEVNVNMLVAASGTRPCCVQIGDHYRDS